MAEERQRLFDQRRLGVERGPSGGVTPLDIVAPAQALLAWATDRGSGQSPVDKGDSVYLPSLLYALHVLQRQKKEDQELSVRARIQRVSEAERAREILQADVERHLNAEIGDAREPRRDSGECPDLSQGESGLEPTQELREFESEVWSPWRIGQNEVTVVDLLLPPYAETPSPFLSHPVLVIALQQSWYHGPSNHSTVSAALFSRTKRRLESWITPRRVHLLSLTSHAILLGLTVSLALSPADWIDPYGTPGTRLGTVEAVYVLWVIASLLNASTSLTRAVFHIPSVVSIILALLSQPANAFSFLAFSIFPLTLLLIIPAPPSLSFIDKALLPLSTSLIISTRRAWRSVLIVLGLAVGCFVVLSWSMNGDVLQGLDEFSVDATDPLAVKARGISFLEPDGSTPPFGAPPNVAPYETRAWLFTTFVMLLLLSVVAGCHRLLSPSYSEPSSGTTSRSLTLPKSTWEGEYGPVVASRARTVFAETLRDIVRDKPLVPPLNLFLLPLLPLQAFTSLLRAGNSYDHTRLRWEGTIRTIHDWMFVFLVGPLCLPLHLVSKLARAV